MNSLNLRCCTWNVNTKFPPNSEFSLKALVGLSENDKSKSDLIIIGLQEVNSMPSNYLFDSLIVGKDPWSKAFENLLTSHGYLHVTTIRLLGIVLSLYILDKHICYIRSLETQYHKLGFGGYWGSKGTVSIRLNIYGVSLCFLNSHLPAHDHLVDERVKAYDATLKQLSFSQKINSHILFHDYIFWEGDLNFRLMENSFDFKEISMLSTQKEYGVLLHHDQLKDVQSKSLAFSEFSECPRINFPPTYKYSLTTLDYDSKRRPAYTDRILYKINDSNYDSVPLHITQKSYDSHSDYNCSDHKPVSATFTISVFDSESAIKRNIPLYHPLVSFITPSFWRIGENGEISYTLKDNYENYVSNWDYICVFKAGFSSLEDYVCFTWASSEGKNPIKKCYMLNSAINLPGNYVLIYFSADKSVLGMSQPFPFVYGTSMRSNCELGIEASEEMFDR